MKITSKRINFKTRGETDIIDITGEVTNAIKASEIRNGIVTIFVPGATGAVTTIEYEPGLLKDLPAMLERIAPKEIEYEHEKRWHDGNGHSHVRASLLGPSITIPFEDGRLTLGTWQQIVFIELDNKSRSREIVLQIMGDGGVKRIP
ncbi:MAG: YjbQ family protein [Candidatus Methanolliviera hydrocarbonicum]|uniref:YjbQ family protein n=1 Tax=Candidatus Methanolliviera hydrocarbonicum TaxID=2491085 RepID=A0A520KX29_9EURY|nr:MAG: YjbQ family protein [Candidatus Methanolliviera hydrocarbonicum]